MNSSLRQPTPNFYQWCNDCNWQKYQQFWPDKAEDVNMIDLTDTRYVWALGDKYVLKQRELEAPNGEVPAIELLQDKSSIPVAGIKASWSCETHARCFVIQDLVKGLSLDRTWKYMLPAAREKAAHEVTLHLLELRQHTSDKMQSVDGKNVFASRYVEVQPTSSPADFRT